MNHYSCFSRLLSTQIWSILGGLSWLILSCTKTELVPIIAEDTITIAPTIVSIQSTGISQAELVIKAGFSFDAADWQLTALDKDGHKEYTIGQGKVSRDCI